jgi:hypothetical protein
MSNDTHMFDNEKEFNEYDLLEELWLNPPEDYMDYDVPCELINMYSKKAIQEIQDLTSITSLLEYRDAILNCPSLERRATLKDIPDTFHSLNINKIKECYRKPLETIIKFHKDANKINNFIRNKHDFPSGFVKELMIYAWQEKTKNKQ